MRVKSDPSLRTRLTATTIFTIHKILIYLPDITRKSMTFYSFSVKPTIPDSENLKFEWKKLMKKKIKAFAKKIIKFRTSHMLIGPTC